MGITKDNKLYGIGDNGNLYKIDVNTAKETLVGSTGVIVSDATTQFNVQSGEIDHETGIFYWACTDVKGKSALYTVDLTTGKATKIGDFMNNEQIAMLSIPKETVKGTAPALASNMSLAFDKASLTGNVNFTAPTTTYAGGKLTGSLDYVVSVDGKEATKGTVNAGEKVSASVTTKRGIHSISVICSNSAGNGPKAYVNGFIGDDTPLKPANVKATVNVTTGKVQLSWDAVTKGINNGYVGDITYNVVRYPDKKAIATATTVTSLNDNLPNGDFTGYYYTVQAVSGTRKSEAVKSNSVSFGKPVEPPYTLTNTNENSVNVCTILDANNDGVTWKYLQNDGSNLPAIEISNGEVTHDDWLILPALSLKAGVLYNLTYRLATMGQNYPELLEVKYGSEPTAAAMVHEIAAKKEYGSEYRRGLTLGLVYQSAVGGQSKEQMKNYSG